MREVTLAGHGRVYRHPQSGLWQLSVSTWLHFGVLAFEYFRMMTMCSHFVTTLSALSWVLRVLTFENFLPGISKRPTKILGLTPMSSFKSMKRVRWFRDSSTHQTKEVVTQVRFPLLSQRPTKTPALIPMPSSEHLKMCVGSALVVHIMLELGSETHIFHRDRQKGQETHGLMENAH